MARNEQGSRTFDAGTVSTDDEQSSLLPLAVLAAGDAVAILVFAAVGVLSHHEQFTAGKLVITAIPFLLGWFLVAPLVGAFKYDVINRVGRMAVRTLLAWLPAWAIALTLRGLLFEHAVPELAFMIVALISNALFLLIWRLPFAFVRGAKKR
jgi:hypothetical protein